MPALPLMLMQAVRLEPTLLLGAHCPEPLPVSALITVQCTLTTRSMSLMGHLRRFEAVCDESGLPPTPDVLLQHSEPALRANNGFLPFWAVGISSKIANASLAGGANGKNYRACKT